MYFHHTPAPRQIDRHHCSTRVKAWRSIAIDHQLVHIEMPRHVQTHLHCRAAHPRATCDVASTQPRQIARECFHADEKEQRFEAKAAPLAHTIARRLDRHQYPNRARDQWQ